MARLSAWTLVAVFSLLAVKGLCDELFNLADAFDDEETQKPTPPAKPTVKQTTRPANPKPKQTVGTDTAFFQPTIRADLLPRSTANPLRTSVPPRNVQSGPEDFDLGDALNPDNDIKGKKGSGKSNDFSDDDLLGVGNDGSYTPDKPKGSGGHGSGGQGSGGKYSGGSDETSQDMPETGTIAGIVSAVVMTLAGAVGSYISYQKKKFCFGIQQSLNADMVKAEAPDAVVSQEPQVQQTLLQPPNAEPPTEENAV